MRRVLSRLLLLVLAATVAHSGGFNSTLASGAKSAGQLSDITVRGDTDDTNGYLRYFGDTPGAFYSGLPRSTYYMEHCTNLTEAGVGLGMTGTETEVIFNVHANDADFLNGATQCWCVGGAGCTDGLPGTGPTVAIEECDGSGQNCSKGGTPCANCDLDRVGICDQDGIAITGGGTINGANSVRVSVTSVNPTVSTVVVCNRIIYDGGKIFEE